MTGTFEGLYADAYDLFYRDKDYAVECDVIEQLAKRYSKSSIRTFLDLGCGTGNHAVPLARRGYDVYGVDRAEHMLAKAFEKSRRACLKEQIAFVQGDVRHVNLHRQFDIVLMMFAVLGYQTQNADVLAALRTARRHLDSDGLLLFDVWYGPAVLAQRPSDRIKTIATERGEIIRAASGTLDPLHHLCNVRYDIWHIEGDRVIARTQEKHVMRYFFPLELQLFLDCAGFQIVKLAAFPDERELDDSTWNLMGIARAVDVSSHIETPGSGT